MLIAITRADGGVSIQGHADGTEAEIVAHHIEAWKSAHPGEYVSHRPISGVLPTDKIFRDAWADDGADVGVDMPRARTMHMARIREARNKALTAKDAEIAIAEDGGAGPAARLRVERQALRDLPATVDLDRAATPEALMAIWPAELG